MKVCCRRRFNFLKPVKLIELNVAIEKLGDDEKNKEILDKLSDFLSKGRQIYYLKKVEQKKLKQKRLKDLLDKFGDP